MTDIGTRQDHIEYCKQRALEYVDMGNPTLAIASMFDDMAKHSTTVDHPGLALGSELMAMGMHSDSQKVRDWIEGFN